MKSRKILICTVSRAEPVINTIKKQNPDIVFFITSPTSKSMTQLKIIPELNKSGVIFINDFIELPSDQSVQNLEECVSKVREKMTECFKTHKISLEKNFLNTDSINEDTFIADVTGGTTPMSIALALVILEYTDKCDFTYTYKDNDKTDSEEYNISKSPWDSTALPEIKEACKAFNRWDFHTSLAIMQEVNNKFTDKKKQFYSALIEIITAYLHWDKFNYDTANNLFKAGTAKLKFLEFSPKFKEFVKNVEQDINYFTNILDFSKKGNISQRIEKNFLPDLVSNAYRCYLAGRYDDSTARLYSAIEKTAKITLLKDCGIDNSNIDLEKIPEPLHEKLMKYKNEENIIEIPYQASYELLHDLKHKLGEKYMQEKEELRKIQGIRNKSLLAHGYEPIDEKKCKNLLDITLNFLNMKEEDLQQFIKLEWRTVLLEDENA